MGNASNVLKENVLNHYFRNQPVTSPSAVYLALYKSNPTELDVGEEISGGAYARQLIYFSAPEQVDGTGVITNTNAIAFPEATADWTEAGETVGFWGIRTAATGGILLAFGEFLDPSKPNQGKYSVTRFDQFNVGIGRISVEFNLKAGAWLQNAVLNHFFRGTATAGPSNVFLALYMTDPTVNDIGVEVSYGAYARQPITFEAPVHHANGEAIIRNIGNIDFPIPDVDLGDIAFFGIRSDVAGGDLLAFSPWAVTKTILSGMQFSVNDGNLEVSMS